MQCCRIQIKRPWMKLPDHFNPNTEACDLVAITILAAVPELVWEIFLVFSLNFTIILSDAQVWKLYL